GLLRWVSERYVAPLATIIGRSVPPRVVSEESNGRAEVAGASSPDSSAASRAGEAAHLAAYRGGKGLVAALRGGAGAFLARPAPEDEHALAVEAVALTLRGGRTAVVVVPEAEPLPATAAAVAGAFPAETALFVGGSRRARYRM